MYNTLDVKAYDPITDTIEIEGTRYSGQLFREFGCNFPGLVGHLLRVEKKENGIVTITKIYEEKANEN